MPSATWNDDGISRCCVGQWHLGDPRGVGRRDRVRCSRLRREGGGAEYKENESGKE